MSRSGRRGFLLSASAMLGAPIVARAQIRKPNQARTIGYLSAESFDAKFPTSEFPSTKALKGLGWIEGRNIVIERRFAAHDPRRLAEFAQDLVRKRVELIVAYTGSAAVAAARATRTIPIVFINIPFPVEQGLVDSFARPGRNITGTSIFLDGVGIKRFEFLHAITPVARRVYIILASEFLETVDGRHFDRMASIRTEAERLGFELHGQSIRESKDVEAALSGALAWGAQAIFPAPGVIPIPSRHRIVQFALQQRLPSMFSDAGWVEAGGLLSYGISWEEHVSLINRSMQYVDRILKGANPADLPVDQPRHYELVINLKTAAALGLKVPQSLLLRADRVIE